MSPSDYPKLLALGFHLLDHRVYGPVIESKQWQENVDLLPGLAEHLDATGPHIHSAPEGYLYAHDAEAMLAGYAP